MTTTGAVVIAEVPVVTTMVGAVLAWMINRVIRRLDRHGERLDEVDREQASLTGELGKLSVRVGNVEVARVTSDATVAATARRLGTVGEELAVLAGLFERHERWHERHDHPAHEDRSG